MERTKTQFSRLLELDQRIRNREYPNCLKFAAYWEVSQKTVQRDIDYLRDQCGAPIAYDREKKGFYYENAAWMLPSVMLSEGDLLAVLLASRVLAQYRGAPVAGRLERVFQKLSDVLPDKVAIKPELLYNRFSFRGAPAKPVDPEIWATVVRALLDQRTLKMRYRPFDVAATKADKSSTVNPYHIANLQGEWYLFGVHQGHTDIRQFSMARIESAELTADTFDIPADFDPGKFLDATFARYAGDGETYWVRLLFNKDVSGWVTEREWHPAQKIMRRKNGAVELSFPAAGLFEVQRWVLSWGRNVRVLAPGELKRMVKDEIRKMVKECK
jgi:proteasome accessory factor B